MEAGAAVSQGGTGSPDWNQFQIDILCPLCDYNLRGLSEPRCPECGHQFVWAEVLAVGDRTHPYLFEHQPHQNLWSFRKTLLKSLRPRKFWHDLRPIHPPVLNRLLLYWVLLVSPLVPLTAYDIGHGLWSIDATNASRQASWIAAISANRQTLWYQQVMKQYGSLQAAADTFYPRLNRSTFPSMLFQMLRQGRYGSALQPAFFAILLWPWMTLASLLIFRASLAQARIKTSHVLRCVLYSSDVAPLIVLTLFVVRFTTDLIPWFMIPYEIRYLIYQPTPFVLAGPLLLTYRLAVSYRLYLRFPHAVASVIASQVIVVLAMMKLALMLQGY